MTYDEAVRAADIIYRAFGQSVVFREPSKRVSYQAIIDDECLPPGSIVVCRTPAALPQDEQTP